MENYRIELLESLVEKQTEALKYANKIIDLKNEVIELSDKEIVLQKKEIRDYKILSGISVSLLVITVLLEIISHF